MKLPQRIFQRADERRLQDLPCPRLTRPCGFTIALLASRNRLGRFIEACLLLPQSSRSAPNFVYRSSVHSSCFLESSSSLSSASTRASFVRHSSLGHIDSTSIDTCRPQMACCTASSRRFRGPSGESEAGARVLQVCHSWLLELASAPLSSTTTSSARLTQPDSTLRKCRFRQKNGLAKLSQAQSLCRRE